MTSIITWLMGTRLGRGLSLAAVAIAALGLALLRAFGAGNASARAAQNEQSIKNLRDRSQTDDDVAKMADDERRRALSEWMREG